MYWYAFGQTTCVNLLTILEALGWGRNSVLSSVFSQVIEKIPTRYQQRTAIDPDQDPSLNVVTMSPVSGGQIRNPK